MRDRIACALLLVAALLPPGAQAADYTQAPGSTLAFAGEYDGEVFAGRLPGFHTTLAFDPARPGEARLDVVVPLAGVDTGSAERDDMLRDAAFFAVSRFPQARYTATGFRALGDGQFVAEGTLDLRGVRAPGAPVAPRASTGAAVSPARASVSRSRFGVGGGDWADTTVLPDAIAISARVVLQAD